MLIIEDEPADLEGIINTLGEHAREYLRYTTAVCLTRNAGIGTAEYLREWLASFPELQVAAPLNPDGIERLDDIEPAQHQRLQIKPLEILASQDELSRWIASMLRPGGFCLQDVQLDSLLFVPTEESWRSFSYLTRQIRSFFNVSQCPEFWFMSNKHVFPMGVGKELRELRFTDENILRKDELRKELASKLEIFFEEKMPLRLEVLSKDQGGKDVWWTVLGYDDQDEIFEELDFALWQASSRKFIHGKKLSTRVRFNAGKDYDAVQLLFADRFGQWSGVDVGMLGSLVAPEHEKDQPKQHGIKFANRFRSKLKTRSADPEWDPLLTVSGKYKLTGDGNVGRILRLKASQ